MLLDEVLRYAHLAFQAVALLDQGEDLHLDGTRKQAEHGTLLAWLRDESAKRIDVITFHEDADRAEIAERFVLLANAADTSDLGIANNGLAPVVAH